jgi:hypothetical protein
MHPTKPHGERSEERQLALRWRPFLDVPSARSPTLARPYRPPCSLAVFSPVAELNALDVGGSFAIYTVVSERLSGG